MRDKKEFDVMLRAIDGREPAEYGRLAGDFDFTRYVLHSLRIPAMADAEPEAVVVIHVPQIIAGFPAALFETPIRRTALEDFLTRQVAAAIDRRIQDTADRGSAKLLDIARPGRKILPRSSLIVAHDYVEARVNMRLPLRDGRIDADRAGALFFEDLPAVVNAALIYCYLDEAALNAFVHAMEDADAIRQALPKRGLSAFIAAGEGIEVADELAIEMETPNAGRLRGVGIPNGITLLIGDRNSGRSELIRALSAGVYNHVPCDGMERIVTVSDAVEIVAEPGRPVQRVDLRPFVRNDGGEPALLTTGCADALESQMASVVEAFQAGSQTLLIDEAFSAPDFLVADARLEALPLSAPRRYASLSERLRGFADEGRVTCVVGADACAAQFIPAADMILLVENGRIRDVTKEAKALGIEPVRAGGRAPVAWNDVPRWIVPSSIDPAFGRLDARIEAEEPHRLKFGQSEIDLRGVPQLADAHQTRTIGLLLYYAKLHYLDESRTVAEVLDMLDEDLSSEGLDAITREVRGDLARPRRYEIAAALNRLDTLRVTVRSGTPAGS